VHTYKFAHSRTHPLIRSRTRSLIRSLIHLRFSQALAHIHNYLFTRPLTHLSSHLTVHSITHYSLTFPSTYQLIHPPFHSFPHAHSLTLSLIHSLSHLSTHSPITSWEEHPKQKTANVSPFSVPLLATSSTTTEEAPERGINIYFACLHLTTARSPYVFPSFSFIYF
jgi:hypothetical protein